MDYLICHQANQRFIDLIAKKIEPGRIKITVQYQGSR